MSTAISEGIFTDIGRHFGLPVLKYVEPASNGRNHKTYFAKAENGEEFVIRLITQLNEGALENEIAVQEQLIEAGLRCNTLMKSPDKGYIYQKERFFAVVSRKLSGNHPLPTLDECRSLGRALADFHRVVKWVPHATGKTLLNITRVSERMAMVDDKRRQLFTRLLDGYKQLGAADVPLGIGHCDLHLANALASDGEIAILDLENAAEVPLILDLARSAVDVCGELSGFSYEKLARFIEGYESVRPLSEVEMRVLAPAMGYAAAAVALWFWEREELDMADYFIQIGRDAVNPQVRASL